MNVKFHKNCESTGEILKISCVKCNFVKFDNHFVGLAVLFLSLLLVLKAYQLSLRRTILGQALVSKYCKSDTILQTKRIKKGRDQL